MTPASAPSRPDGAASALDLLQSHPVPTLVADPDGAVIEVNQAAESLFNRARSALLGQALDRLLVSDGDPDGLPRIVAQPSKTVWAYSTELAMASGAPLLADIAFGPAGADGRRVVAIHPVPRGGRTPFRRPGAAARSAGAAAAMLAHEVKNPLSGIRGAAQLLGKGAAPGAANLSRLICGEVDRIAGLIDSMQGFTQSGPMPLVSLNIYPAIGQARGIAAQGFAARIAFSESFDPSLPRVLGNHDALVQILLNLIKNASEALLDHAPGAHQPRIRIATAYRHGLSWNADDGRGHRALPIELAVLDNGPGVPDTILDALFDPFVTGKRDGQGLGLALVDKLVRDMGGVVQHDRHEGWTRFRLHLPVAAADDGNDAA